MNIELLEVEATERPRRERIEQYKNICEKVIKSPKKMGRYTREFEDEYFCKVLAFQVCSKCNRDDVYFYRFFPHRLRHDTAFALSLFQNAKYRRDRWTSSMIPFGMPVKLYKDQRILWELITWCHYVDNVPFLRKLMDCFAMHGDDREFMKKIAMSSPYALKYLPEHIRSDQVIVLGVLETYWGSSWGRNQNIFSCGPYNESDFVGTRWPNPDNTIKLTRSVAAQGDVRLNKTLYFCSNMDELKPNIEKTSFKSFLKNGLQVLFCAKGISRDETAHSISFILSPRYPRAIPGLNELLDKDQFILSCINEKPNWICHISPSLKDSRMDVMRYVKKSGSQIMEYLERECQQDMEFSWISRRFHCLIRSPSIPEDVRFRFR